MLKKIHLISNTTDYTTEWNGMVYLKYILNSQKGKEDI